MISVEEMAKVLLEKLSKENIHTLCSMYVQGYFETLFIAFLIPADKVGFPTE
jgi:hypothetical protein